MSRVPAKTSHAGETSDENMTSGWVMAKRNRGSQNEIEPDANYRSAGAFPLSDRPCREPKKLSRLFRNLHNRRQLAFHGWFAVGPEKLEVIICDVINDTASGGNKANGETEEFDGE